MAAAAAATVRRLEKPRKRREAREGQKARKAGKKEREKREYTAKEERSALRIIASDHRGVNGCYWAYHTYTCTHTYEGRNDKEGDTRGNWQTRIDTANARLCGYIRRPGGRRCANGERKREREDEGEREMGLSPSLFLSLSTGKGTKAEAAASARRESLYTAGHGRVLSSHREDTTPFSGYRRVPPLPPLHILTYHISRRTSGTVLSFSLRFTLTDCLRLVAHPFASSRWLRSLPEDTPGVVWVSTEPVVGFPRARRPSLEKTSRLIIISMSRQGRHNAHDVVQIAKFVEKNSKLSKKLYWNL